MDIDLSKSIAGVQLDIVEALRHVIDGEFIPSVAAEYKGAHEYTLVTGGCKVYVQNDDEFLYVAFADVSSDGFVAFNVYKAGVYSPERLDAPGVNYDGEPFWDALADNNDDDTFDDAVTRVMPSWKFKSAIATRTEFKIPLANLGIAAGDTILMGFVFFEHGVAYVYPATFNATLPLTTYQEITLTE